MRPREVMQQIKGDASLRITYLFNKLLLTKEEASFITGLSEAKISKAIKDCELPVNVDGLISRIALDSFIDENNLHIDLYQLK